MIIVDAETSFAGPAFPGPANVPVRKPATARTVSKRDMADQIDIMLLSHVQHRPANRRPHVDEWKTKTEPAPPFRGLCDPIGFARFVRQWRSLLCALIPIRSAAFGPLSWGVRLGPLQDRCRVWARPAALAKPRAGPARSPPDYGRAARMRSNRPVSPSTLLATNTACPSALATIFAPVPVE